MFPEFHYYICRAANGSIPPKRFSLGTKGSTSSRGPRRGGHRAGLSEPTASVQTGSTKRKWWHQGGPQKAPGIRHPPSVIRHPPIHLSVHPSIHPSIHLSVHPTTHPSVCLSIHLSTHPTICLSVHPTTHPSVHPPIHPSVCPYNHPSVCPTTHPPVCLKKTL